MRPVLHRIADAYRPLAARNRLIEGPHRLPPAASERPPRRRMTLLALLATLSGRRP